VGRYSTSSGSRRCQYRSSAVIRMLPNSPLAVGTVPRGPVMSSPTEVDSCRRRRRSRQSRLTVPSLAVASAIIRTQSSILYP